MELPEFIVKAKKSTYAGNGEEKITKDGGKELEYKEANLEYRDKYYGFNPFSGEEVVWKGGKTVWIMNYYGWASADEIEEKIIYNFLKKALSRVSEEKPFRGPDNFKEGDFEYINEVKGDIKKFSGTEIILYKGREVHKVLYFGGSLQ